MARAAGLKSNLLPSFSVSLHLLRIPSAVGHELSVKPTEILSNSSFPIGSYYGLRTLVTTTFKERQNRGAKANWRSQSTMMSMYQLKLS